MLAGTLPPLSNRIDTKLIEETQQRLSDEIFFDKMMKRNNSMAIHLAFEPILSQMFQADRSILWIAQSKQSNTKEDTNNFSHFYSPTLNKELKGINSLVSATAYAKTTINCISIDYQEALDEIQVEPQSLNLFFPLYLRTGSVVAICHITRNPGSIPFDTVEIDQTYYITHKFKIYGTCTLNTPRTISLASEVSIVSFPIKCIEKITNTLKNSFLCKNIDFWIYHPDTNTFACYDPKMLNFVVKQATDVGIVSHSLRAKQFINEKMSKYHVNYKKEVDGDPNQPIIVGFDEFEDQIYAVALRGKLNASTFSVDDDKRLFLLMPFISRSISFSFKFSELDQTTVDCLKNQEEFIKILDFSSEITQIKDLFTLINKIQEKATKVVNCKSAKILIINEMTNEFNFNFDKKLGENIKKPLDNGFAGKVYKLQEPVISNKPETDPVYDPEIDSMYVKKNVTPHNLLSLPIFSSYDKVIAVLTLFNKHNNQEFDQADEDSAVAFSVFCGIALQNTSLYQSSLMIINELNEFSNLSKSYDFTSQDSVYDLLESLLHIANEIIHASRLSLFLIDSNTLFEFMTVDAVEVDDQVSLEYAETAKVKGKTMTFQVKQDNKTSKTVICCTPLFSSDRLILGVIEFCCEIFELQNEIELIESFSMLTAVIFEKSHLKQLSDLGQAFYDVNNSISVYDLSTYEMPREMDLKTKIESLFGLDFDINSIPDDSLLKLLFTIINDSEIRIDLKIPNQNLFYFLNELSNCYRPIEYFNWKHALNTFQYVYYILKKLRSEVHFTFIEILSLFLASISHDTNHNGFADIGLSFGIKTRRSSPNSKIGLDLLFDKNDVMEMHHCAETIKILSKNECNLFSNFNDKDSEFIWEKIIDLILSTNMAKHFDILAEFNQYFENHASNIDSSENKKKAFLKLINEDDSFRSIFLKMLIKAADLSDCCRIFEVANRYKNFVPIEFFVQGRIDNIDDFNFWTSPNNNNDKKSRTLLKPNASTIPFYRNVCLPFFESLSQLSSQFDESVLQLKENIKKWESMPAEVDVLTEEIRKEIEKENEKSKKEVTSEKKDENSSQITKITFNNGKKEELTKNEDTETTQKIESKEKSLDEKNKINDNDEDANVNKENNTNANNEDSENINKKENG